MATSAIATDNHPTPARRRLRVSQYRSGIWHLQDSAGLLGGHFATARAAVAFVRLENCPLLVSVDGLRSVLDA